LRRLRTDYIDVYYAHFPDPDTPLEQTLMVYDDLVRQGELRYVALSNQTAGCWPACRSRNGTCVGRRSVLCRAPSAVGCLGCVGVWRLPVARTFHEDGAVTTTYVRGPRHLRHCTGSARILDVGIRVDGASEAWEREG
jgi:hypothetical protein